MANPAALLKTALGEVQLPDEYLPVLAHANRSYYLANADGLLLDVGPVLLELLQYDLSGLKGMPFDLLLCPTYRELGKVVFEKVMEDMQGPERVWSYRKSNGDLVKIVADHLLVSLPDHPKLMLGLVRLIQVV